MKTAFVLIMVAISAMAVTMEHWGYCDPTAVGTVGGNNNWYGVRFTPPEDCATGNVTSIEMWTGSSTGYTNPSVRFRIYKFDSTQTNPVIGVWSDNFNFTSPVSGPTGAWATYTLGTPFVYVRSVCPEMLVAFQSESAPSQPTRFSLIGYDGSLSTPNRNWIVVNKNMPQPGDWSLSTQGDYMIRLNFNYQGGGGSPVAPTSLGNIKANYH